MEWLVGIDTAISEFVRQSLSFPFLDSVMIFITRLGDAGIIWIALSVILLFTKKYRRFGVLTLIALTVCVISGNYGIKPLFARVRPANLNPDAFMLVPRLDDFSFPSMHTASSFSAAMVLNAADRRFGIAAFVVAVLIGLSRIYLYLHYTTDVIAGALFGALIAFLILWIDKKRRIKE